VRSRAVHLIGAVVLAFCAPVLVSAAASASTSSGQCTTTTTAATSSGDMHVCVEAIQIKHIPVRRLQAVVRRQAAELGEHHPLHAAVVISTRRAATTLTGSIANEDSAIYFVQAQGQFTCGAGCFGPPGAKAPTGHYLTLGLSLDHLDVLDFGIANQSVNLRKLGPVHGLSPR
jgi:hypothetical protein